MLVNEWRTAEVFKVQSEEEAIDVGAVGKNQAGIQMAATPRPRLTAQVTLAEGPHQRLSLAHTLAA